MKKNTLAIALAALLAAACTEPREAAIPGGAATDSIDLTDCIVPDNPMPNCGNVPGQNPGSPKVDVNFQANQMAANPEWTCTQTGKEIVINIAPGNLPHGSVSVIAHEPGTYPWLTGTNSEDNKRIEIKVPDWQGQADEIKYLIFYGGQCLDPRLHVM